MQLRELPEQPGDKDRQTDGVKGRRERGSDVEDGLVRWKMSPSEQSEQIKSQKLKAIC